MILYLISELNQGLWMATVMRFWLRFCLFGVPVLRGFQNKGFKKCAIISSYEPKTGDLRTEATSDEEDTEVFSKYEIYNKMLDGQSAEDFETEAKRKFINEPNNMKLLIVVDKLLTGFDAPPCTYLYIDKAMHDHGLFQAICRVNRLDGESKEFGYIVDYKELLEI